MADTDDVPNPYAQRVDPAVAEDAWRLVEPVVLDAFHALPGLFLPAALRAGIISAVRSAFLAGMDVGYRLGLNAKQED